MFYSVAPQPKGVFFSLLYSPSPTGAASTKFATVTFLSARCCRPGCVCGTLLPAALARLHLRPPSRARSLARAKTPRSRAPTAAGARGADNPSNRCCCWRRRPGQTTRRTGSRVLLLLAAAARIAAAIAPKDPIADCARPPLATDDPPPSNLR